jgi:hypothetical protein
VRRVAAWGWIANSKVPRARKLRFGRFDRPSAVSVAAGQILAREPADAPQEREPQLIPASPACTSNCGRPRTNTAQAASPADRSAKFFWKSCCWAFPSSPDRRLHPRRVRCRGARWRRSNRSGIAPRARRGGKGPSGGDPSPGCRRSRPRPPAAIPGQVHRDGDRARRPHPFERAFRSAVQDAGRFITP